METLNVEDFSGRFEQFVSILEKIEKTHYYWFESRHGLFNTQEHDVIANHIVIDIDFPLLHFGYWQDSELPQNIRDECNSCYQELFS